MYYNKNKHMKNYYTIPLGIFLSLIAIMNLLPLISKANTLLNITGIIGLVTLVIVIIKTKVFTNFKLNLKTKTKK